MLAIGRNTAASERLAKLDPVRVVPVALESGKAPLVVKSALGQEEVSFACKVLHACVSKQASLGAAWHLCAVSQTVRARSCESLCVKLLSASAECSQPHKRTCVQLSICWKVLWAVAACCNSVETNLIFASGKPYIWVCATVKAYCQGNIG